MLERRIASSRSRFSSPGSPKMRSTPSFSSPATSRSAAVKVVVVMAVALRVSSNRSGQLQRGEAGRGVLGGGDGHRGRALTLGDGMPSDLRLEP